jgi:quinol monooxygenase YgiN
MSQDLHTAANQPIRLSVDDGVCALINVFTVAPERQEELLQLLISATEETMKHQPGFISASFHKSLDGAYVCNYAQWESKEAWEKMTQNPEAQVHMRQCQAMASAQFHTYTLVSTHHRPS